MKDEQYRKDLGYKCRQNYYIPFKYYTKLDWAYFIYRRKRRIFYNHISAKNLLNYINRDIWNNYFKFCFERNPWDKVISQYYWLGFTNKSIEENLNYGIAENLRGFELYTIGGVPVVDKVYKYEELEESMQDISYKLGLKNPVCLPSKKIKSYTRIDKRHYSEILTS